MGFFGLLQRLVLGGPSRVVSGTRSLSGAPTSMHGRCRVLDGDTLVLQGMSIRLGGIDAPELDHPYGRNAKWALVKICKGQLIRAELADVDAHGRTVARCYLPDGRELAAEMVRMGHAIDWPKYSGGRYRHLEVPGVRKRLWRCDARQKGRMPPAQAN